MIRYISIFIFLSFPLFLTAQSEYSILSLSSELMKNSNVLVVEDSHNLDLTNPRKMLSHTKRVYAVLNELGNSHVIKGIGYDEHTRVKTAEVVIYDAFGKRIKRFRKKDFSDRHAVDNVSLYVDSRIMYLNYTPASYPYFIEVDFETESSDTAFLPSWRPIRRYAQAVQNSQFIIKYNNYNKPKFESSNLEAYDVKIQDSDGELIFSINDLSAITYEELAPSDIFPKVQFALDDFYIKGVSGTAKDWSSFGSWMDNSLLNDASSIPPSTIARVRGLVANETTIEGKARKVYQFVQDKVRYISVQIGIGGWKPMRVSDVDKLSYGDCKALTHYTKTLLELVGVPTYYTVIYAGENGENISNDFASFQGNHVILGIPENNEITWLECTSQSTPYGFIGDFTDDRDALIITPEGGKIVRTKIYSVEENLQSSIINATLDRNGNLTADLTRKSQGLEYDPKYLLPKRKSEDIDRGYKNEWGYVNGLGILNYEFTDNREEIIFTENINVSVPDYATSVGEDIFFTVNILNQNQYVPPRIINRIQDLSISKSFTHRDVVEMEISDKHQISVLPDDVIIKSEFGSYSISFSKISNSKFKYQRELIINKGIYPKESYGDYRDFRRDIAKNDQAKILLTNVDL